MKGIPFPIAILICLRSFAVLQYYFSVNLDSVYDGPFAPVYQLAKVEMDKRNIFQLLVQLSFHNGLDEETQQFYSKPFMMRSRPRNDQGHQANKNKKRKLSGKYEPSVLVSVT